MNTNLDLGARAEFSRRVQENPQLAVDLLVSLHRLVDRDFRVVGAAIESSDPKILYSDLQVARSAVANATGQLQAAAAHYCGMAREIASRTGEEVLPEHLA